MIPCAKQDMTGLAIPSEFQSDILEQHLDLSLTVSCPERLAFVCFSFEAHGRELL